MAFKRFSSGLVTLSLSIILPCLALSSILELALKNAAPKRPENWNELTQGSAKRATVTVILWPQKMFPNEEGLLNASAALALLTTLMMSVLGIIASRKGTVGTTKVRLTALAILAFNLFLATASFLFSFIQSRVSSRVDIDYIHDNARDGEMFVYDKGRFTSEIWSCGIDGWIMDGYRGEMEKACAMHLGARWLTFTTFILSAALFAVAFFDSRREGHILYASRSSYAG